MQQKLNNIKKMYKAFTKAKNESDKLDKLVNEGNYDLEKEWDEAYEKEFTLYKELSKQLSELLNVDLGTAKKMIYTEKFESIINSYNG